MAKALTLEESFQRLEEVIDRMESGDISLEESFKLYSEGMKLVKNCNAQLDKVEKQLVVVGAGEEE